MKNKQPLSSDTSQTNNITKTKTSSKNNFKSFLSNANVFNLAIYAAFCLYYSFSFLLKIINLFRFKSYASPHFWSNILYPLSFFSNILFSLILLAIFVLLFLHTSNSKAKILKKIKFTKQKNFNIPFIVIFCDFIINDLMLWIPKVLGHDVLSELLLRAWTFFFMFFALLFIKNWSDRIMNCIQTKNWNSNDIKLCRRIIIVLVIFILLLIPVNAAYIPSTSSGTGTDKECSICGAPATHGSFCTKHFDSFADWESKQD